MTRRKTAQPKDALARIFDGTSASHGSLALFSHFGEALVAWARLRKGDRVLDVGAGTGASLIPAARVVGPTGHVVGVDIAPGMVDRLAATIAERDIRNATARVADAENLPFPSRSFDAALCGFGLFFFPEPQRALSEFRRILRPGGMVALSTFTRRGSDSMDWMWALIGRHVPAPPPAERRRRFDDADLLRATLEAAGFRDVEVEESPYEVVLPGFDAWWDWLRSMEFRALIDRMDRSTRERFRSAARAEMAGRPDAPQVRFPMDTLLARARR